MARRVGSEDRRVVHLRATAKGAGYSNKPVAAESAAWPRAYAPSTHAGSPSSPAPPTSSTVSSVPAGDPLLTAGLFVPQVVEVSSGNLRLIFPALFSPLRGGLCYFSYGIRACDSHEFI